MTSKNFGVILAEINGLVEVSKEYYGDYSYVAGYLQAQLALVLAQLPAHKQEETLKHIAEIKTKFEQKGI